MTAFTRCCLWPVLKKSHNVYVRPQGCIVPQSELLQMRLAASKYTNKVGRARGNCESSENCKNFLLTKSCIKLCIIFKWVNIRRQLIPL
jgi:hypothetical protein